MDRTQTGLLARIFAPKTKPYHHIGVPLRDINIILRSQPDLLSPVPDMTHPCLLTADVPILGPQGARYSTAQTFAYLRDWGLQYRTHGSLNIGPHPSLNLVEPGPISLKASDGVMVTTYSTRSGTPGMLIILRDRISSSKQSLPTRHVVLTVNGLVDFDSGLFCVSKLQGCRFNHAGQVDGLQNLDLTTENIERAVNCLALSMQEMQSGTPLRAMNNWAKAGGLTREGLDRILDNLYPDQGNKPENLDIQPLTP